MSIVTLLFWLRMDLIFSAREELETLVVSSTFTSDLDISCVFSTLVRLVGAVGVIPQLITDPIGALSGTASHDIDDWLS